jgi:DNA-binding GntR family transcriptional regulator
MQIEYPSLSDVVYEHLSKQIIEGNIKYGEKLNIKAISEQFLDAVEMRELLELHAVKLALRTMSVDNLRPILEIIDEMKSIIEGSQSSEQVSRYIYLDLLFHTELCRLAGNDYLEKFYREVNLHLNMTFIYRIGIPPDINESFADHKQIAKKLAESSPESLELLGDHLERSRGHIIQGELFSSLE